MGRTLPAGLTWLVLHMWLAQWPPLVLACILLEVGLPRLAFYTSDNITTGAPASVRASSCVRGGYAFTCSIDGLSKVAARKEACLPPLALRGIRFKKLELHIEGRYASLCAARTWGSAAVTGGNSSLTKGYSTSNCAAREYLRDSIAILAPLRLLALRMDGVGLPPFTP